MRTAWSAARVAYLYKMTTPNSLKELRELHSHCANILLQTCLRNEGLYIKLGQITSTMNHILPSEYVTTLQVLLDRAPPVALDDIERTIYEETGRTPTEIFEHFDPAPVASASIAQVHRAKLRDTATGELRDVAVKIQKPNIRRQIKWDLLAHHVLLAGMGFLFDLPLSWVASTVAENLQREADFRIEAANTEKMQAKLSGYDEVFIPKIYTELLTERLLVSEWVDAVKMSEVENIRHRFNAKQVMNVTLSCFGDMIFRHGFVHCDPHPANVLIRPHPKRGFGRHFQIVLIDFGLCMEESEKFRTDYSRFFTALFSHDMKTLESVVRSWGIADTELFTSLQLLKPFSMAKPMSEQKRVSPEDVLQMQQMLKTRLKSLLENDKFIPRELVFVGRTMTLLRYLNKSFGSPVNRVNLFAQKAAAVGSTQGQAWSRFITDIAMPMCRFYFTAMVLAVMQWAFAWYGTVRRVCCPGLPDVSLEDLLEAHEAKMAASFADISSTSAHSECPLTIGVPSIEAND